MPKSITVVPSKVRMPSVLKTRDIPVNAYKSDPKAETKKFGPGKLNEIYQDMLIIREFETSLNEIKQKFSYQGIEYDHKGPAHLSIGQESAAVGMAYGLTKDDFIFGSHRSHGEILAKGLSTIHQMDDAALMDIMENYMGGVALKVVEKGHKGSVKELATDYLLYGTLAEIFAREAGFNKGLGGSMHAFFPPFGIMPNNAIVGGSGDVSVGAALFKRINRKPGIVVANIGDASLGCGPVWEGLMMSAMEQYRTLWDKDLGGGLPIIFNFMNNFYGMGGQPEGETMGLGILARLGAGINSEGMHSERVDGFNPLAVMDAIERKKAIIKKGLGPVLLDTITYRFSGHSPSDASSYRDKDEVALWEKNDAILSYAKYLSTNKHSSKTDHEDWKAGITERLVRAMKLAVSLEVSPRMQVANGDIAKLMFSNTKVEKFDDREPEVLMAKEDNPRVIANSKKSRSAFINGKDGEKLPKARVIAYRDSLFEAMLHRFYIDPTMVAYGEENRDWGGAFAVYRGLTEALPYHRLFNSPISEAAIVGSAVGYALCGGRVVAELMYCDFMGRAGDEIFNQMSKWQSMSGGLLKMPLVLRVSVGSKYGAQHSQDWTSMVAHIPGLKAMFPATPYDAKGMLNLALAGTDPVVFFESQRLYDQAEIFEEGGVPEGYYEVEEGKPAIRRAGKDITIITIGATMYRALEAADELQAKYGLSAEVIDCRFINPLDYDILVDSVKKTGRCVVASDACERGSFAHNIASNLTQITFDYLDAPITVVGARNWITPAAELEETFFPQKEWFLDTIHERVLPLTGHQVTTNQTAMEMVRRNKLGV